MSPVISSFWATAVDASHGISFEAGKGGARNDCRLKNILMLRTTLSWKLKRWRILIVRASIVLSSEGVTNGFLLAMVTSLR